MGLRGAEKIIAEIVGKVAPNKNAVPYILRHSRATFLAKMGWNKAKLRKFFGWSEIKIIPQRVTILVDQMQLVVI